MTEQINKYWQFTKKFFLKPLKWLTITVLLVILCVLVSLRIPYIQTKITKYASEEVSKILKHKVTIAYVNLNWIDKLALDSVVIYDVQNRPMIFVREIEADFDLKTIYTNNNILIENVLLKNAIVTIQNLNNSKEINMSHFADVILELTSSKDTTRKKKKYTTFGIAKITLEESNFTFDDNNEAHRPKGFDNYHFGFHKINGQVSNFRLIADTVDILFKNLQGVESKTKLDICNLNTFLRITDNSIHMQQLQAYIGNSLIRDSLVMKFDSYRDFNDFNHKIHIEGNLDSSYVHTKDLAIFDEYLNKFDDYWGINGYIKGTVDAFTLKNSRFSFGKNSSMQGNFRFDGLPNFWDTFFDLKLTKSHIDHFDIEQYAGTGFDIIFKRFGYLNTKGYLVGFPTDFVTKANFESSIGSWYSDLNLKIDPNKGVKMFEGDIKTYNLNLGILTANEKRVQHINLDGHVEGNGFDPEVSEVKLKAKISSVSIENRIIKNIETDAVWAKKKFAGYVSVNDSNVVLTADGLFDLTNNVNEFKINGNIHKMDLKALGIVNTNTFLSTKANLNFKGLKLDDLNGTILLNDFQLIHENKPLLLNQISISSWNSNQERSFMLNSDLVDFKAKGQFLFSRVGEELQTLFNEYEDFYINRQSHTDSMYTKKMKVYKPVYQNVYFNFNLKNITPITEIFYPNLMVSKNADVSGFIKIDDAYTIGAHFNFDKIIYNQHQFQNLVYNLDSHKPLFNDIITNDGKLKAQNYTYNQNLIFDTLQLRHVWKKDSLIVNVDTKQQKNAIDIGLDIRTYFDKPNSKVILNARDRKINLLNKSWKINPENSLVWANKELEITDLFLQTDSQNVAINGFLSSDKSKPLNLNLQKFKLNILDPLISFNLNGESNAELEFRQLLSNPIVIGNVFVKNLEINKIIYGDLVGKADWVDNSDFINLNADLIHNKNKVVNVSGKIFPNAEQQLQLKALFDNTNIKIVEPIFSGTLTDFEGFAKGVLNVNGSFSKPLVLGKIKIDNGKFRIDYLNSSYRFNDHLIFTQNSIGFRNTSLIDYKFNKAIINGGVEHNYFSNYKLNIDIITDNIHALNTTYKDNDVFYGNAFIKGNMSIKGPINDLDFTGNITSLPNTQLHIPIGGITKVSRGNYISFVNRNSNSKATFADSIKKKVINTTGIRMNLNLFLTPDAETEIIFDSKTGDVISGKGDGKIKLEIDTKGDFNMYGDYVFSEGEYNFTMLNAFEKAFTITPGSKISWIGDPYGGRLNVKAKYIQQASLLPLVTQGYTVKKQDSLLLSRRYPCEVSLGLTGDLMSPEIGLGLTILQTPAAINIYLQDFKTKMATNEQELNKQVFSLVMLGRFTEEYNVSGNNTGSTILSSGLGEFFSNQLTHMLSQVDKDLQIDINLNTTGADGLNAVKLRLSRVFLDNRLRISVEDGFSNTGKSNPNASAAGLAGNWTVEYMLLKNGVLRAKIYNRTTQVANISNNTVTNTSVGISIMHTKDFDKLKELLNFKTNDQNKEEEDRKNQINKEANKKDDEELTK